MAFPSILAILGLIGISQVGETLQDQDFIEMRSNFTPNMDLDDLADKCFPIINKIIETYQNEEDFTFIAGKFTVRGCTVQSFNITYELDFQGKNDDEWPQVLRTSNTMSSNRWLSENARRELDQAELNEVHFDIKGSNTLY